MRSEVRLGEQTSRPRSLTAAPPLHFLTEDVSRALARIIGTEHDQLRHVCRDQDQQELMLVAASQRANAG